MTKYPKVDYKKWAEEHDICIKTVECKKCYNEVGLDIPFEIDGYRGLEAGNCTICGTKSGDCSLVPIGEKLKLWNRIGEFFGIKGSRLH